MKNIIVLMVILASFSFGQSIYKKVDGATNSGISKAFYIPDSERPKGFIIKHVKDDVTFDKSGKVLDKDGNIKMIRLNVKFDFDKYDLKDEYKDEIDEAVSFLNKHKMLNVLVEGHTDSIGTDEYNYVLSVLRAKKVADKLKFQGVNKKRIIVKGYGETMPIAENKSEEGRALNRRVDISFIKKEM